MLIPLHKLRRGFNVRPRGVLHIGANIGEEAESYYRNNVSKVVWIEGNHELFPRLAENVSKYQGHTEYLAIISDVEGPVKMNISNNAGQSSSLLELGTHKTAHPEVRYTHQIEGDAVRIDTLVAKGYIDITDCDFLNIDLQGAELMALRSMGDHLKQFKWAYLEVNKDHLYEGCPLVEDIDLYMISYGFRRVVTEWAGNTGWGDCLFVKEK